MTSKLHDLEQVSRSKHCRGSNSDVVVFSCLRNEVDKLPHFVDYHRTLGVCGFVFIDNASTDASREWILDQDDCTLLYTDQAYSTSYCGVDWLNQALDVFSQDAWALILDLDELIFYPYVENFSLPDLARYIDHEGRNALASFMLDMYAPGPLSQAVYTPPRPFLEVCPLYDPAGYSIADSGTYKGLPTRGGPRQRLFWTNEGSPGRPPVLGKCPLVRWSNQCKLRASTHVLDGIQTSDVSGVLLHFKFFSDLHLKAQEEADRGQHWDNAAQYRAYSQTLQKREEIYIEHRNSKRLRCSQELVDLSLMRCPKSFRRWVESDA